jgi:hypothetical protein
MKPATVQDYNRHVGCVDKSDRNTNTYSFSRGTAVAQWLRYCATNREVAGSIPRGVIGIFH